MAHLVETMAYAGATPWHGLGNQLTEKQPTVRSGLGLEDALEAKQLEETRQAAGFDQSALDDTALEGFRNGAFEDSQEDTSAIVEEFFPTIEDQSSPSKPSGQHLPDPHYPKSRSGKPRGRTAGTRPSNALLKRPSAFFQICTGLPA